MYISRETGFVRPLGPRAERTRLVPSVVWAAWIVLIFSYGSPAPIQEVLTAIVPPALGLIAVSTAAWVAER